MGAQKCPYHQLFFRGKKILSILRCTLFAGSLHCAVLEAITSVTSISNSSCVIACPSVSFALKVLGDKLHKLADLGSKGGFLGFLRTEPRSSDSERVYIGYRIWVTVAALTKGFWKGAMAARRVT